MPDIFSVFSRHWKFMLTISVAATVMAWIVCLLSQKQYVGVATALPANSLISDKARIFNRNIEALYAEIGTADELDKLEGTAKLDTIFLAAAADFQLPAHYTLDTNAGDVLEKAVLMLRKKSDISRTGYGELKVKVWDKDNQMAAALANALLQNINAIHQRIQSENSQVILQLLKKEFAGLQARLDSIGGNPQRSAADSVSRNSRTNNISMLEQRGMQEQLENYQRLINEYELSLKTAPRALLVVESARPSPWADKPKTVQITLITFFASLLFAFLLAILTESRKLKT